MFSLSGKIDLQIPCFPCAVATLSGGRGGWGQGVVGVRGWLGSQGRGWWGLGGGVVGSGGCG